MFDMFHKTSKQASINLCMHSSRLLWVTYLKEPHKVCWSPEQLSSTDLVWINIKMFPDVSY